MLKKTIFFDLFGVLLGWSITGFKPLKPTSLLQGLSNYHLLYIISNTSNGQINVLKNKFDFFQYFTKIFTSETIGHNKPDLTIFKYALQEAKTSPNQSIFIDDSLQNTQSAGTLGIVSHHYIGEKELIKFFEDQEILVPNKN